MTSPVAPNGGRIRVRMEARATDEQHRVSSPLELLFDLTFVVAIAALTTQLGHGIAAGHVLADLAPLLQVFFAIWWAWMNFTWFASSYDTDDVPYRLLTMLQMAGVLVLAAGVPAAFGDSDFRVVTLGYLVMRIGLVAQWVRAGLEDPASRATAFRYAAGITVVQALWLLRLVLAEAGVLPEASLLPVFVVLVVLELAVPPWAERTRATSWHAHHIAERYGLFTIILLGESVFAASTGVTATFEAGGLGISFVTIAVGGWSSFSRSGGSTSSSRSVAVAHAVAVPVGGFCSCSGGPRADRAPPGDPAGGDPDRRTRRAAPAARGRSRRARRRHRGVRGNGRAGDRGDPSGAVPMGQAG